jgi:(2Fe-2S) ferredoxin
VRVECHSRRPCVVYGDKYKKTLVKLEDMEEIIVRPRAHVFVCVNERESTSCGPGITKDMLREVKNWLIGEGLAASVYCTGCLGFCNDEGGVVCVYPKGKFMKGVQSVEDIKNFILEEIK